jgi:hypothetical protein
MMIAGWMFDERPPTADMVESSHVSRRPFKNVQREPNLTLTLIAKRSFLFFLALMNAKF